MPPSSLARLAVLILCASVAPGARAQQRLVIGIEAPLDALDPATRSSRSPTLATLLHTPLLRIDHATGTMDAASSLLAEYTAQAGQEWILDLKPDLKFSDGSPIDAAVVVTNIKRLLSAREPGLLTPHLEGLLYTIAVVSPTRLKMTLSRPHMSLLHILASPRAGIVSPKSLSEGFQGASLAGSGPFRLVKRGGDFLELEANPHYVDGQPRISHLTVRNAPARPARLMWLLAGQGHLVEGLPAEDAERAKELGGCTTLEGPGLGGVGIYVDTARPPFDATWMCDAFFQALDSEGLAPWLYDRNVSVARRALPASLWAHPPGAAVPGRDADLARDAVQSGITVGRPTSFVIGVALGPEVVAPSKIEAMLSRLRFGFQQSGFTALTELMPADPEPVLSRPVAPQVVLFSFGATADDPGLLLGEMCSKKKAPLFKRLDLGPEPGLLLDKVGGAQQLEAHRFLYESIGNQIGDSKRLAFIAQPVRRVTFVTGLEGVRLGTDGGIELDEAQYVEK